MAPLFGLRALLQPPFRTFFWARLVSLLGSAMSPVALALGVLDVSGRPTDLGIVLMAQIVPQLVFLLAGGVLGDRMSRRVVLVASHVGAGLTQGAVAAVILTGHYQLALVACLAAANGAMEAFTSPALRGIVPELVTADHVQRANSVLSTTKNGAKILGPTVSGVLVATVGGGWSIAVDAVSFLLAAALLATLRLGTPEPRGPRQRMLTEFREGWTAFRSVRWVAAMSVSYSLLNLFNTGPWQVLGPTLTRAASGDAAWGVVLSVRAVGLLVMSVVMYRLTFRRPLRAGAMLGTLGALPLLTLGVGAPLPALLAAAFVGALGFTVAGITWDTSLQTHIPRDVLSRVASFDDLLSFAAIPVGQILVGPAASRFGAGHVALVCGIGYVVATVLPLAWRSVRRLGNAADTAEPDAVPDGDAAVPAG